MKWIGLTGSIACGKSTVNALLRSKGVCIVDADEIAREVVKPESNGLKSIVHEFGPGFLTSDGYFDRKLMAQHVFGDLGNLRRLEAILHPLIRSETQKRRKALENAKIKLAVYDMPLLFETKAQDQFDAIIVVSCTSEQQKKRLSLRDDLTEDQMKKRIASQIPTQLKEKQAHFVLKNDRDMAHLESEVERLYNWLQTRFQI